MGWRVVVFVLLGTLPLSCFGQLSWNTNRIELETKSGDKEAVGVFRFTNSGGTVITINEVQPSCGCTTAELTKWTYAPGEAGEIKAVFTIGDRMGVQEKIISVTTDEPSGKPATLVLQVTIPKLFTCAPGILLWRIGDKLEEKSALITALDHHRIATVEINTVMSGAATARIESMAEGTKYRVLVQPGSSAQIMTAGISGSVKFTDGVTLPFIVHALVR